MTFSLPIHARRFGDGRSHHEGLRWPNGAGLAVSFVLNIEEGAELGWPLTLNCCGRALEATIARPWGRPPVGWHSKSSRSVHTRSLLQAHGGLLYDSDDLPHCLPRADGGQHVVLPYAFDTNDMRFFDQPAFVRGADFAAYVGDAIDQLLIESEQAPRMLTIGLYTRIIGRPARIGGLDAVLRQLRGLGPRVWLARREDIARHWLALTR